MSTQPTHTSCRRHNHIHAAYVQAAIGIEERMGVDRAIAFLCSEGVSSDVISRVLGSPAHRRPPSQSPILARRQLYLIHCQGT